MPITTASFLGCTCQLQRVAYRESGKEVVEEVYREDVTRATTPWQSSLLYLQNNVWFCTRNWYFHAIIRLPSVVQSQWTASVLASGTLSQRKGLQARDAIRR
jgi:hypothetical protein